MASFTACSLGVSVGAGVAVASEVGPGFAAADLPRGLRVALRGGKRLRRGNHVIVGAAKRLGLGLRPVGCLDQASRFVLATSCYRASQWPADADRCQDSSHDDYWF